MTKNIYAVIAIFAVTLLSGCELAGDIFKAGAYTAIIGIVLVVVLVFWIISKMRS